MKQILQNLRTGATEVAEIPCPSVRRGHLLISTRRTLISAGTERMLVEFGKAGWISKARQQPEKVRMVMDKIRTDGLIPTIDAVLNKLDQPLPLGYCNVGTLAESGPGVTGYVQGDRIVSNGKHAEMVTVPASLCAKIPDSVSDDEAAFTVIGAIALQGIRLAQPTLGESVVVTGLGLIGLVTVQLLRAHGCRVLGIDSDPERLAMARHFGAETVNLGADEDPVAAAFAFSRGRGIDAVIIAAATRSSEPVHQAAQMCRIRGRIVMVGVTGLELSRSDFYQKELTFQVSCSYGPGRYDPDYEEKGHDYPPGFVRWTAQRNFEAVLDMMADGRLDVKSLISQRFPIDDAEKAYDLIGGPQPTLGILLEFPGQGVGPDSRTVRLNSAAVSSSAAPGSAEVSVSFIGAGNYASSTLVPAFKATGVHLRNIVSSNGVTGVHVGRKYGFQETTTDPEHLFTDPDNRAAIVVATRHDSHAHYVIRAIEAGKHVFVEKPLCLTRAELTQIEEAVSTASARQSVRPIVMVGFNRRFAPQVKKMASLLATVNGPKAFVMTVNAGANPSNHWTQDPEVGGGRAIGEVCHFIDLLRFLAGVPVVTWHTTAMPSKTDDTLSIQLRFANGSIGTVHYLANGHKSFPKERLEVFCGGRVLRLDNFRKLAGFGWPGFRKMNLWRQDKGQKACAAAFVRAVREGRDSPIAFEELIEVARISIDVASR